MHYILVLGIEVKKMIISHKKCLLRFELNVLTNSRQKEKRETFFFVSNHMFLKTDVKPPLVKIPTYFLQLVMFFIISD